MKLQCEVCEKAEAEVLCCADEAVLCRRCDEKVHAANKLSRKHPRVSLLKHPPAYSSSSSSQLPLCDICQDRNGYFFCLEDRAILCRNCDMSIHNTASSIVSSHQRFLIGGIKVALESTTTENPGFKEGIDYQRLTFSGVEGNLGETAGTSSETDHLASAASASASASASWPLDDILSTNEFCNYDFSDMESSRITDP
ncbi:hypothetical protein Pint_06881 [Pistacia integerrima]|uniref:Uncharacterized protein n=1 Tax=Pistacia integerrima TaxID=434235 RepID=A0ACC0XV55_9ROSI|nr:hypothetical protein Pint_06881 [Pistacia integerrima]